LKSIFEFHIFLNEFKLVLYFHWFKLRKVNIIFSLVEESQSMTDDELLEEISKAFGKEGIIIPWVDELVDIKISLK